MSYSQEIIARCRCSDSDKEKLLPLIESMAALSTKARGNGLLALTDDWENAEIPILKLGLSMILEGYDPNVLAASLQTNIEFSESTGKELLASCIIARGLYNIQCGTNPKIVQQNLTLMLGDYAWPILERQGLMDPEML